MSSYSNNYQEDEGGIRATDLWKEWKLARSALNRYQEAIDEALRHGIPPGESKNVRAAKGQLHTATLSTFTALRPYAIEEPDLWEERELDAKAGLFGLQCLEDYQLTWRERQETIDKRHGGVETITHREMNFLPDQAYKNAVHAMLEGMNRDGFIPEKAVKETDGEPLL